MTDASDELKIRPFESADEAAVVDLWHRCGLVVSWNDPHEDIATKMGFQPDLFLVGTIEGLVVATAMAGYEGHRGWINYLAVLPELQRRGIGRRMMQAAENKLRNLGCPKVNLQVRDENEAARGFYAAIGYRLEPMVSFGKRLISDE